MNAVLKPEVSQWAGCYSPGWGKTDLVPEAFGHPAKLAKGLGFRIVEHALEHGWVKAGDTCVDPFGGVATSALALNWSGINYVGCELEPRFVGLAQQNIDQWQRKYGRPGFGKATILQGDSRKLCEVIGAAGLVVSSPPYAGSAIEKNSASVDRAKQYESYRASGGGASYEGFCATQEKHSHHYGTEAGQLGVMKEGEPPALIVSSPPFLDERAIAGRKAQELDCNRQGYAADITNNYGVSDGQLGAMKEGDAPAIVISSPPYAAIAAGACGLNHLPGKEGQQSGRSADSASQQADSHYGESEGQLSTMREGAAPALIVSSPPFQGSLADAPSEGVRERLGHTMGRGVLGEGYGTTTGQLGSMREGDVAAVISGNIDQAGNRSIVPQCQHAKIAVSGSVDVADGVKNAVTFTCPRVLLEEKNQMDMDSTSQQRSLISPCRTAGESHIHIGTAEANPGADTHGDQHEGQPYLVTATSVANADHQKDSKSITLRMQTTQEGCGITHLETSKHYVRGVTSECIRSHGLRPRVQSVVLSTGHDHQGRVVQINAEAKLQKERGQSSIKRKSKNTSALNVVNNSSCLVADGSIVRQSVCEQQEQNKKPCADNPDTFWAASKLIVQQCYQILRPGGHAIWIVKDFVRAKKRVPFSDQWQALCEAQGFRLVCRHQAMLVANYGEQEDAFGAPKELTTSRKSFFRRLAEKKGSPAIDHEDIICMVKA